MESKRVTCPHCDFLFYPEEGVSLDDCPVCGRTVEVKPAPAPLPILVEATLKGIGHDYPGAECTLRAHISDLTRRLAEVEAELEPMRAVVRERTQSAYEAECRARRAENAEARVRELEVIIGAMDEAHAHDDQALTAAYMSGAHEGKKQAEAFKSRVMEWARGQCECCEHKNVRREDTPCEQCLHTSNYDNWTLPQALEVGE